MNITGTIYSVVDTGGNLILPDLSGAFYNGGKESTTYDNLQVVAASKRLRHKVIFDASKTWTGEIKLILSYFYKIIYNKRGI